MKVEVNVEKVKRLLRAWERALTEWTELQGRIKNWEPLEGRAAGSDDELRTLMMRRLNCDIAVKRAERSLARAMFKAVHGTTPLVARVGGKLASR